MKQPNEKKLLGERIKELRKLKGLSQEVLAEKADTSQNYLSRVECGKENPTLDMLIKLSRALAVEMSEMFDFGHDVGVKELKDTLTKFIKEADEEKLRTSARLLKAVMR